ncbi:CpsD/CapB family tyrosine-protein kinase [Heliorestis convoluta]|uniref:non-specific protein-tyrosine kinase n=1 Tax=Heliorestis convoluta TaxID=356322 RepID=A0A5Q2N4W0_9FIRM|nr:CpsD/CapB family tyrosine-protein kinase [Heliorestis convoluta]QGG47290.1 capsular exopolysaccharide protein AAA domain [Heliorestis convoluta]
MPFFNKKTAPTKPINGRHLYTYNNPKSPIAEAYRTIRTSMHYASADDNANAFLFTSAAPEEGKSTTIANLAVAYAQTGTRTLLIDCDLRKPTQHRTFQISNGRGLTNILVDNIEPQAIIAQSALENLHILTSGPVPPNPSELLQSNKMKKLLQELKAKYDLILIDTPPTLAVTDAAILASTVDGIILVIQAKKTKITSVQEAQYRLQQANGKIIGTILNGTDIPKDYYYYYQQEE